MARPKRSATTGVIKRTTFRFDEAVFDKLDVIATHWAGDTGVLENRTDVIRRLIHREYVSIVTDKKGK